jgi:hypothetical protein
VTLDSPEDVAANANGMLTVAQGHALRRMLWHAQWSTILKNVFLSTFALCVLAVVGWLWLKIRPFLNAGRDPLSFTRSFHGISVTFPGLRLIFAFFALWFVLLLWQSVVALHACARVWRELRPGNIVSAVGAVMQHRGSTVALVGGRSLVSWEPQALEQVSPGHYRCWFLPRRGRLLSVQLLRDWERPTPVDEAVTARWGLAAMNGFDAASLADNRAGVLTATQIRDVARRERRARPGQLLLGTVSLVIGVWFAFSIWHLVWHGGVAAVRDAGASDILWEAAAAALFAAVGCITLNRAIGGDGYRQDLRERRVAVMQGPVTRRLESSDSSMTYACTVGDQEFPVSYAAYNTLIDGLVYRLYYTPRSRHLVNVEWIEQSAAGWEEYQR